MEYFGKRRIYELRQEAAGASIEYVNMLVGLEGKNHVVNQDNRSANVICVPSVTLDHALRNKRPCLIKMDVEGFETAVIRGGALTLENDDLMAVIMETNGLAFSRGFDEDALHSSMLDHGFIGCRYDPFTRELVRLGKNSRTRPNTLMPGMLKGSKESSRNQENTRFMIKKFKINKTRYTPHERRI